MITEREKNKINQSLALGFLINSIRANGLKLVYKDIDSFDRASQRIYLRNLVQIASTFLTDQGERISFRKPRKRKK